jgi:hypothetical protein
MSSKQLADALVFDGLQISSAKRRIFIPHNSRGSIHGAIGHRSGL